MQQTSPRQGPTRSASPCSARGPSPRRDHERAVDTKDSEDEVVDDEDAQVREKELLRALESRDIILDADSHTHLLQQKTYVQAYICTVLRLRRTKEDQRDEYVNLVDRITDTIGMDEQCKGWFHVTRALRKGDRERIPHCQWRRMDLLAALRDGEGWDTDVMLVACALDTENMDIFLTQYAPHPTREDGRTIGKAFGFLKSLARRTLQGGEGSRSSLRNPRDITYWWRDHCADPFTEERQGHKRGRDARARSRHLERSGSDSSSGGSSDTAPVRPRRELNLREGPGIRAGEGVADFFARRTYETTGRTSGRWAQGSELWARFTNIKRRDAQGVQTSVTAHPRHLSKRITSRSGRPRTLSRPSTEQTEQGSRHTLRTLRLISGHPS